MKYDENKDPELEKKMVSKHKRAENPYDFTIIVIGPEGAALQVDRENSLMSGLKYQTQFLMLPYT